MKAVIFSEHGGPKVLRYAEVREPEIGADEVLVRVRACALNHLDLWVRRGLPGITIPMPHILGSDIAGEVARVGGESGVRKSERVLLSPGISCGHCVHCLRGEDNFCPAVHPVWIQGGWRVCGICGVATSGRSESDAGQSWL